MEKRRRPLDLMNNLYSEKKNENEREIIKTKITPIIETKPKEGKLKIIGEKGIKANK